VQLILCHAVVIQVTPSCKQHQKHPKGSVCKFHAQERWTLFSIFYIYIQVTLVSIIGNLSSNWIPIQFISLYPCEGSSLTHRLKKSLATLRKGKYWREADFFQCCKVKLTLTNISKPYCLRATSSSNPIVICSKLKKTRYSSKILTLSLCLF